MKNKENKNKTFVRTKKITICFCYVINEVTMGRWCFEWKYFEIKFSFFFFKCDIIQCSFATGIRHKTKLEIWRNLKVILDLLI